MRFTLNAMANLEDKYGSIDNAFSKISDGKSTSMLALRFILWQALRWEDASLTEEGLGDLIDIQTMNSIAEALGRALNNDMPEQDSVAADTVADPNALPPATTAGTGPS